MGFDPSDSVYANIITPDGRYVLAYQKRNLSDVIFQGIIHYICNIEGKFWFLLCAQSDNDPLNSEALEGHIFVFKSKHDWRGIVEDTVKSCINNMNDSQFSLDENRSRRVVNSIDRGREVASNNCDVFVYFTLNRTGEVKFSAPKYNDDNLEFASNNFAVDCGHDFPRWIANQCYFFLRDMSHLHQHHEPHSDTILVLQERDKEDIQWRRNIIYSLYYYIIRSKRYKDAYSLYQSVGVLAYCGAFKNICQRSLGERFEEIPEFDDDALRGSLSARADEDVARQRDFASRATKAQTAASTWRTCILAGIAIVIAFLAILIQPRVGQGDFPVLDELSDVASKKFVSSIIICIFVLSITWILTSPRLLMRWPWERDVFELANVYRKRFAAGFLIAAALITALTAHLFSTAVDHIWQTIRAFSQVFGL